MQSFLITGVDQSGVDGVMYEPPAGVDFGSLIGRPVSLARKVVGSISRVWKDNTGPWCVKVSLDDMNALRMSATGTLTRVAVGKDIELRDFIPDLGKSFQYTDSTGQRLCKRFIGLPDQTLEKYADKVYADRPLTKNERYALLVKGTEFEPVSHRKPVTSREQFANANARATSNSQFGPGLRANRNAEALAYSSAQDRQRHADPETEPWTPASTSGTGTPASVDWPNGLPVAGASQFRTELPNRNSRT